MKGKVNNSSKCSIVVRIGRDNAITAHDETTKERGRGVRWELQWRGDT